MRQRLTFAYDYAQVYLYDSARPWPDDDTNVFMDALDDANARGLSVGMSDGLVDLLMVRQDNSEAPLQLEVLETAPSADLDGWDHVVEFPLGLPSGSLTLEPSGGSEGQSTQVGAGVYTARWSARRLDDAVAWDYADEATENPPDEYRLQLWSAGGAPTELRELKRSSYYDAGA
jgi:hypothetical protein